MRTFKVVVDGTQYSVEVEEIGGASVASAPIPVAPVATAPVAAPVVAAAPVKAAVAAAPAGGTKLIAPMPGDINKIIAASGTKVKKGQAVVVLEAMKMENDIAAPVDGTVTIMVKVGDKVNTGDILAVIA